MKKTVNAAASALGKMGRGIPKTITDADRQRRRDWGKTLNAKRQAKTAAQKVEPPPT